MGWCTTNEVWHDKEGTIKMYEINLSAEYINISFIETIQTIAILNELPIKKDVFCIARKNLTKWLK